MSTSQSAVDRLKADVGELIAEHSAGRPVEEFTRWADDPVGFYRLNGRDPVDYQEEILRSYVENKYRAVRGCHGCGKEFLSGSVAAHAAICRGMLVLVVSATELQVVGQTMKEVRRASRSAGFAHKSFTRSIRIGGADRIIALTGGSSIDALTGWHDPQGVLIIISEAQGEKLEDSAYDAALAVAVGDKSRVLVMGNPTKPSGRFAQLFSRDHWSRFKVSAFDTPNVKAGKIVRPGFPSPGWPAEVAREYGQNSPYYRGRVLAEIPSASEESLFDRRLLELAANRWEDGMFAIAAANSSPILAVDPARHGPDSTAVAVRRGPVLQSITTWHGADTMETVDKVIQIANESGISREGRSWRVAARSSWTRSASAQA